MELLVILVLYQLYAYINIFNVQRRNNFYKGVHVMEELELKYNNHLIIYPFSQV